MRIVSIRRKTPSGMRLRAGRGLSICSGRSLYVLNKPVPGRRLRASILENAGSYIMITSTNRNYA